MQTGRKDFLRMMAAEPALRPSLANAAPQQTAGTGERKQPFVQRVIEDYAAALGCALCYIGDRLGLFKVMAKVRACYLRGSCAQDSPECPHAARVAERGHTAAGYLEYRPLDKTYILPNDHAEVLADEESSPMFRGGLFQFLVPVFSAAPQVANTFQTGKPALFPLDRHRWTERSFAPAYKYELVQKRIPLLPGIQEKLTAGASAVDVACGTGVASVVLAKAFPKSEFTGYDPAIRSIPTCARSREERRRRASSAVCTGRLL